MYEYYLDFKGITNQEVLSKTALEALNTGCIVVTDDLYIHNKLKHTQVQKFVEIFEDRYSKSKS